MKAATAVTTLTFLSAFAVVAVFTCAQALAADTAVAPIPYSTLQVIEEGDSDAVIAEKASKVLPRPNQTAWMRLERTFFLHFGAVHSRNRPPVVMVGTRAERAGWGLSANVENL